jgi:hypothetical protein
LEFEAFLAPELTRLRVMLTEALNNSDAPTVKQLTRTPVAGCARVGAITMAHQHVFGVLNLCVRGQKQWCFWAPSRDKNDPYCLTADVELTQEQGQLIWVPPAWWHWVATTGGDAQGAGLNEVRQAAPVEAMHWATTLLPPQQVDAALAAVGCAGATEAEATSQPNQLALYRAMVL